MTQTASASRPFAALAITGPVQTRTYVETSHRHFEILSSDGRVLAHRWSHIVTGYHYVTDFGFAGQTYSNLGTDVVTHGSELDAKRAWVKLYRQYN